MEPACLRCPACGSAIMPFGLHASVVLALSCAMNICVGFNTSRVHSGNTSDLEFFWAYEKSPKRGTEVAKCW